ncbi:unnamed protein product [Rhizoctonia solani]|uniref:Peptidase C14 caspase domain-containing protein n=1 Tax=Rhizoctonia solani TaxID=456999 RepID=A0A8H3D223_9AGAM|nr:unnamed protein product [Rhizoctonia solani]
MSLVGAAMDRRHILEFLEKFGFTTGVKIERVDNALRKNIEDRVKKVVGSRPPLLVIHFQGHGVLIRDTVQYITSDQNEGGTLEGLTAEELIEMFSNLTIWTMSLVSDHRFLSFGQFVSSAVSTGYKAGWVLLLVKIVSPMLHVAGSLRWQQVYETEMRGGYLTNSLAQLKAKPMTLPHFLLELRQGVYGHLEATKAKLNPLAQAMCQDAQIFSSDMWPLDDPQILLKIRLGTARPVPSTSTWFTMGRFLH